MSWGTLTVGRIPLRERYELSHQVNATTGAQGVSIEGIESAPPWTAAQARARQEDIIGLLDRALPVIFSTKDNHTGFYTVSDTGTVLTTWPEADWFGWNLSLQRIGTENAVDMESRLASVVRQNDFALTGERWHAPAVNAYAYFTGTTQPTASVGRALADSEGTITVYRGIPAAANPMWGITAPNYLKGRVRVLVDDLERSGTGIRIDTTQTWELNNGLVRITPLTSGGVVMLESWDGGAWSSVPLDLTAGGGTLTAFDSITVMRNDFECVAVRLVKSRSPYGRILLDLTLRRGSRAVEAYFQCDTSSTMGVSVNGGMATTDQSASGYLVETANDAQGNRFVMGSPRTFTYAAGSLSKAASTALSFFAGHVIDGSAPATGDAATDVRNQYIGALAEQTVAVKR